MLNAYSCPVCPLAFEVGIDYPRKQWSPPFVCLACGTMRRIPTPAGLLPPDARYPLQALPGPLRRLTEEQVQAVVSTRRDGVWVSESRPVTRRVPKVDQGVAGRGPRRGDGGVRPGHARQVRGDGRPGRSPVWTPRTGRAPHLVAAVRGADPLPAVWGRTGPRVLHRLTDANRGGKAFAPTGE